MKKYIIILLLLFNIFIMNAKGVNNETLANGPVTWNNFYYTRINNETGHMSYSYMQMLIRSSDNTPVYCIEPGVLISYDEVYFGYDYNQARFANLSREAFEKVSLIAYFGYGYKDTYYDHTDSLWWAVTQWMIWQEANNNHTLYFTQNQNYNGNEPAIERFTEEMAQINALINDYYTKPAINIPTLILGQTLEINDSNGVLHNYQVTDCRNCHARIDGNKLIITATNTGNAQLSIERTFDKYNNDPIVYISTSHQNAMAAGKINNIHMGIGYFTTSGQLTVHKKDADNLNSIAQGNAELNNAVYGIYNMDNQLISSLSTDNQGIASINNLSIGSYYLKEMESSKGYTIDTKKYYFDINNNSLNVDIDVYEKVIEKRVEIIKVKANSNTSILEPETDILFEFYLKSTNELIESIATNDNGKINIVLPYGNYIVHQVNSPDGIEKIKDFEIAIDESNTDVISKVISNSSLSARVKVIKISEDSHEPIKIPGIKFKIKNLDTDQYVCQYISYPNKKEICVFKTNNEGIFITPYPLEYGNYQIEEIDQEITGYLINTIPLKFSITEENIYYDTELGLIIDVPFSNKKAPIIPEEEQSTEEQLIDDDIYIEVPNTEHNNYYIFEIIISFIILLLGVNYVKKKEH